VLTREHIKKNLLENPDWEPEGDLTHEEWRVFDEVYDEMDAAGEFKKKTVTKSEDDKGADWNDDDEDSDDDWDDDAWS
jgi:hypothetical protein